MSGYLEPQGGASLLLAFKSQKNSILIIGSNTVAATRIFAALDADYTVLLLDLGGYEKPCSEIQHRISKGQVTKLDWSVLFPPDMETTKGIAELLHGHQEISLVCVADTAIREGESQRTFDSAKQIYEACQQCRVPVNVTDIPELCSFTFPATHRFSDTETDKMTPLQISVTTNGKGCRLGGRIKRDLVSKLPKGVGMAVEKVGRLRELAQGINSPGANSQEYFLSYLRVANSPSPNEPFVSPSMKASIFDRVQQRMRWVAQVSEFWQIERLAALSNDDMNALLYEGRNITSDPGSNGSNDSRSHHGLDIRAPNTDAKGKIYLLGSGIGHPSLLTVAAHDLLSRRASVVLSDKLVPSAVLDLIPKSVKVVIARKFPGNADEAQNELMEQAIDAASKGEIVVRLKQGDPMVYGRAGEEILYLRERGFEPVMIPGVSSAISGPAFANIPVTQRGVAESFIVCTGVGRQGKSVQLPGYRRERTTVILMGVARLAQLVQVLIEVDSHRRYGAPYPTHLPIAIVERASMPDQRVVLSTLNNIEEAFASLGSQRPPGMIVVGWAVLALNGYGLANIRDDDMSNFDEEIVKRSLGNLKFKVLEGLSKEMNYI